MIVTVLFYLVLLYVLSVAALFAYHIVALPFRVACTIWDEHQKAKAERARTVRASGRRRVGHPPVSFDLPEVIHVQPNQVAETLSRLAR